MNKNQKHQSPSTLFNFRRTFTVIVILNVVSVSNIYLLLNIKKKNLNLLFVLNRYS